MRRSWIPVLLLAASLAGLAGCVEEDADESTTDGEVDERECTIRTQESEGVTRTQRECVERETTNEG